MKRARFEAMMKELEELNKKYKELEAKADDDWENSESDSCEMTEAEKAFQDYREEYRKRLAEMKAEIEGEEVSD